MNYKGLKVLVLDGYGRQVPSVLKQLHKLGCEITTVNDHKLDIGNTSRYPKHKVVLPGIREDVTPLRNYLEKVLANKEFDVVFPMLEKATDLLLTLEEEGKLNGTKLICASRESFDKAYDKEQTMKICQENGIPCPLSKMDNETLDEYLAKVKFPLACKPRKGSGAVGFVIAQNKEHLDKLIAGGLKVEEYVIQEYIPHTDYHYGVYLMFDNDHKPIYDVVVTSCRQYPVDGGPGCFIKTVKNKQISESARKLLQVMDWTSFGHVGFIMDPRDGIAKVMEINGRIPAGVGICYNLGIPTVKYLLDRVYGEKLEEWKGDYKEGVGMRHFQADFMWLLKSPDRFTAKPNWFNFSNSYDYVWNWKDPVPFFSYSLEHILTYRKDIKKRKH